MLDALPNLPVARRRFFQLPLERQEEILSLAAREFAKNGFQGTSYNQLLERLQLGKSSAYYYFDDKLDLFLTAVQRCYAQFFERTLARSRPRDACEFWVFVQESTLSGFEFMIQDPVAAQLMQCFHKERSLLGGMIAPDFMVSMNRFYEEFLEIGQALGAVRTDAPQSLLIDTVRNLTVSFDQWFIRENELGSCWGEPARAAEWYVEFVRRLLEAH